MKGYTTTTPPAGSAGAPALAQPGYYVPTASASSETPDDPGYYRPYEGATAETIDGHPAHLPGSAGVTDVTQIPPGGWRQLIDQDFAGVAAAQFDNIASGLLLLSPSAAATPLNIGVTVPSVTPVSGLYGDLPTPSAEDRFLALTARS